MFKYLFDLQLFAEDGDIGSAGYSDGASSGYDSGEGLNATDTADIQDNGDSARPSFDELIKGDYKDDYQKSLEKTLKRRMRGHDQLKARMDQVNPVLGLLAQKYGVSVADANKMTDDELAAVIEKVQGDDSYYEDEAYKRGIDVGTLKELKAQERELAQLRAFQQNTIENSESRQKFEKINREAEQVRSVYPNFDLDLEMENPEFERLAWNAGVPLQTAYEVIHHGELLPHAMQYATQQAAQQVANSVRSGYARPQEGGNMSRAATLTREPSPRNWTKEQREDVLRRVRAGERIVLR